MFQFLIFLLIFGVIILFSVLFGVLGFLRMLFRGPRQRAAEQRSGQFNPFEQATGSPRQSRRSKVISDREGEYVDYEEIK